MNIEQAIDILKNSIADYVIGEYCEKCADNKICNDRNEDCYYQQAIDIVVTAYEKQSKEIEELKEDNTELKRTYLRTAKHQENIGHVELAHYMLAQIQAIPTFTTWEDYKTWVDKDKIKAKIEEIKEEKRHYLEINDEYNTQICDCIIEEYESLLEKE